MAEADHGNVDRISKMSRLRLRLLVQGTNNEADDEVNDAEHTTDDSGDAEDDGYDKDDDGFDEMRLFRMFYAMDGRNIEHEEKKRKKKKQI